jgi:hypothetical protein
MHYLFTLAVFYLSLTPTFAESCSELISSLLLKSDQLERSVNSLPDRISELALYGQNTKESQSYDKLLDLWTDRSIENLTLIEDVRALKGRAPTEEIKREALRLSALIEKNENFEKLSNNIFELIDLRNKYINVSMPSVLRKTRELTDLISDYRSKKSQIIDSETRYNLETLAEVLEDNGSGNRSFQPFISSIAHKKVKIFEEFEHVEEIGRKRWADELHMNQLNEVKNYFKLRTALPLDVQVNEGLFLIDILAISDIKDLPEKWGRIRGFNSLKRKRLGDIQPWHIHLSDGKTSYILIWLCRKTEQGKIIRPIWVGTHQKAPYNKGDKNFGDWMEDKASQFKKDMEKL